tara:strand:+ start:81 stop:539 length:459 start_codon:yes stop_codon:yes gene_type:complete
MKILALILALTSWGASLMAGAYLVESNWSNIVTIGLIDMFFFWLISVSPIDYIKRRYMCVILSLSILFTIIWSIVAFAFTYADYYIVNAVHEYMYNKLEVTGLTLSLLLVFVSASPRALLYGLDGMVWPRFASGLFDYRSVESNKNTKEGAQ